MSDELGFELAIRKTNRPSSGKPFVLDVNLNLQFGEDPGTIVVFGPSGSGKSTLLECLAGLQLPDAGRIVLNCATWFDSDRNVNVSIQRREFGYVFQSLALFPHLTVRKNVEYGLGKLGKADRECRVSQILEKFHIGHLASHRPNAISGGEQQRVALARALVNRPKALLLDEPFAALDYDTKSRIMDDVKQWKTEQQTPIILVTHALEEVFAMGEWVVMLQEGKITAQGRPADVLDQQRQRLLQDIVQTTKPASVRPGPNLII
jgi:molybdate transport system ATP-binding protein